MSKQRRGMCHLCGEVGTLTYEHIPPRRVFNDRPILLETLEGLVKRHKTPRAYRRGMGRTTLCEQCNGFSGNCYGRSFADWTLQAMRFVRASEREPRLLVPFHIEPLKVMKQIMTMALATTDFAGAHYLIPHRRFVLFPFERHLPPEVRIYVYFNPYERYRLTGNSAVLRHGRSDYVMADIAFPPLGYCITNVEAGRPSLAELEGLCDITFFAQYHLQEEKHVFLSIPRRTPHGPTPLAFKEQLATTVEGGTVLCTRIDGSS